MKIYITKYALTKGITEHEIAFTDSNDCVRVEPVGDYSYAFYLHKGEWFDNLPEAIANANDRRTKKIKSLEKQIWKLRSLEF